jgi:hypothetical protein
MIGSVKNLIALSVLVLTSCTTTTATPQPRCLGEIDQSVPLYAAGTDITPPKAVQRIEPVPPLQLLGRPRDATMELQIGTDGKVQSICQTRGDLQWGDVVRVAMRRWVFEPARRAGEPIPIRITLTSTLRSTSR